MVIRRRAFWIVLATLLVVGLGPAASARADGGPRAGRAAAQGGRQDRPGVDGKSTVRPSATGRKPRRGPTARTGATNWLKKRYDALRVEAHRRGQEVERMRKRLDRDLLGLRRARIALLRCGGTTGSADQRDRVLQEVDRMRGHLARAAAKARRDLAAPVVEMQRAWSRSLGRHPSRGAKRAHAVPTATAWAAITARVSADTTRARVKMTRASRAFGQVVVSERKRVVRLAGENARVASVLLEGPRRPVGEASKRRVSDARRVLKNLKKMGASERRQIRRQLVRDARRIRETQRAVAAIEKRLEEVQRHIRALRAGRKHKPARSADRERSSRVRPVPASDPAPGASTRSD